VGFLRTVLIHSRSGVNSGGEYAEFLPGSTKIHRGHTKKDGRGKTEEEKGENQRRSLAMPHP
jgi:hypothetical protein